MKRLYLVIFGAAAMSMFSCGNQSGSAHFLSANNSEAVYITPYGKRYHRESCFTIQGHDISEVSRSEAEAEGRTPCKKCKP